MKCFICGSTMEQIRTSFLSSWGNYEIEIKGVEPHKCPSCGHEVFSPEEARMIQSITRSYSESSLPEKPEILTLDEVSDLFKVSNQTIYNMIKDGRLPAYKIGREWRFNRQEIERLLIPQDIAVAARGYKITKNDQNIIAALIKE